MNYHQPFQKRKLGELEAACRAEGAPVTLQRRLVLEVLASRIDHPTADQLYDLVRERAPQVSRTTVYRVLDRLVEMGVIRRVSGHEPRSRFDADTSRHHHVQCVSCGAVADYRDSILDHLPLPPREETGFQIFDYSVNFNGLCQDCLQQQGRS